MSNKLKRAGSKNLEITIGQEYLTEEDIIQQLTGRKIIKEWAYVLHDKDTVNLKDENDVSSEAMRRAFRDIKNGLVSEKDILKSNKELTSKAFEFYKQKVVDDPKKWAHWHIIVHTPNNYLYCDELAKFFDIPENFVRVKKTGRGKLLRNTLLDCIEYFTHEDDKQQELGKYRYPDNEIKCSFDFRKELTAKLEEKNKYGRNVTSREKLQLNVLLNGLSLKQALIEDPYNYNKDLTILRRNRKDYLSRQSPPGFKLNLYIEGSGGVGKDIMARSIARSIYPDKPDDEVYFRVGNGGVEFEGYDGQPVVIWEDVRAGELIRRWTRKGFLSDFIETFQETDAVNKQQNVKYSSTALANSVNIFTGADSWEDFLSGLVGEYTDDSGRFYAAENKYQSYRRFPMIIPVKQSDFDILLNEGFMQDNSNWFQYFTYKSVAGSFAKVNSLLASNKKLLREYENKMTSHVVEAINGVREQVEKGHLDEEEILQELENYGEAVTGEQLKQYEIEMAEFEEKMYKEHLEMLEEANKQIEGQISVDDVDGLPF